MKSRLSGILLLLVFSCAISVFTETSSPAYAIQREEKCREKLQNFGNKLILIIGSNSGQNEKITQIISLIETYNLFDKNNLSRRACGNKHYKELIKHDPDFPSKFLRYAVKTVLLIIETFDTKQPMKFELQKKFVSKGGKVEHNVTIRKGDGKTATLTTIMNLSDGTIYNIKKEGTTSLLALLQSQCKKALDSEIKRARTDKDMKEIYIKFLKKILCSSISG